MVSELFLNLVAVPRKHLPPVDWAYSRPDLQPQPRLSAAGNDSLYPALLHLMPDLSAPGRQGGQDQLFRRLTTGESQVQAYSSIWLGRLRAYGHRAQGHARHVYLY